MLMMILQQQKHTRTNISKRYTRFGFRVFDWYEVSHTHKSEFFKKYHFGFPVLVIVSLKTKKRDLYTFDFQKFSLCKKNEKKMKNEV